jgi:transposase InsO family protein
MKVRPFLEAEQAQQQGTVKRACELLEVSRAAFYASNEPCRRDVDDETLGERIEEIFTASRRTYGAPRVHRELTNQGVRCGRKRVARIMRRRRLVGRCPRRFKRTTITDPNGEHLVDLVKRTFGPGTVEVDRVYVGDITYIRTWEGWLYLATVIDLASRRVVGWAMADHMRAELVCDALSMALTSRRPPAGLIFHSDRGSQYTSAEFGELCGDHGVVQSMSRPGQCWDNAVAESFFATLKLELIYTRSWPSIAQARHAVFDYIEVFYNQRRLHTTLGYLSPADYENRNTTNHKAAHAA